MRDDVVDKHESYGMAQFNRISHSGQTTLFGSALEQHYGTIRLSIHTGSRSRDTTLSSEYYRAERELVEVEMSATQFAELITNMNHGNGVPVTIRRLQGERMEDAPSGKVHAKEVRQEFRERMEGWAKKLEADRTRITKLLDGSGALKQADRKELRDLLNKAIQEIERNIPFHLEQFEEAADKVTSAAKQELDALMTHTLVQLGLQKLKEDPTAAAQLLLGEGKKG